MSKKKNHLLYFFVIILTVLAIIGIRSQMVTTDFETAYQNADRILVNNPQYPFEKRGYYTDHIYIDDRDMQFDTLLTSSQLVAVVKPVSRRQDAEHVKTLATVMQVIQGSNELVNTDITIFEQYHFDPLQQLVIDSGCTLPMDLNKTYVVFLKNINKFEDSDLFQYTSLLYSKYPVKKGLVIQRTEYHGYSENDLEVSLSLSDVDLLVLGLQDEITYIEENILENEENHSQFFDSLMNAYNIYMQEYEQRYVSFYEKLKEMGVIPS